jgi:hypothetical protein
MATCALLKSYVGQRVKIYIYRFDRGHSGAAKIEGTIELYVYADLRPVPPQLGTMCISQWLEPTVLILTRFLGREYILGRGKTLDEAMGELIIYLPQGAPHWCMNCGNEMPKCCPTCNRPLDHVCADQQNTGVGCNHSAGQGCLNDAGL